MGAEHIGDSSGHRRRGLKNWFVLRGFLFGGGFNECSFAWNGRVFEICGETCRGLGWLFFPDVTSCALAAATTPGIAATGDGGGFLHGSVDGGGTGHVV